MRSSASADMRVRLCHPPRVRDAYLRAWVTAAAVAEESDAADGRALGDYGFCGDAASVCARGYALWASIAIRRL
eukprot:363596-Chlamydomonas_euryale.AAC.6